MQESEESAKELHEEQKALVFEEDNVRNSSKKLEKTQKMRERRETKFCLRISTINQSIIQQKTILTHVDYIIDFSHHKHKQGFVA